MLNVNRDYELSILVGSKPITEYPHEGMTFVEGRNGSEYKIRIRNNTYRRACFIVSVDGLSVLDGKDAGDNSPGYIIESHKTLDIACYKVDDQTGAKFVFGDKENSYAAEIDKGTGNTGVIAVKIFQEHVTPTIYHHTCFPPKPTKSSRYGGKIIGSSASVRSMTRSAGAATKGWGLDQQGWNSAGTYSTNTGDLVGNANMAAEPQEQQLGTVFGEAMQWQTETVTFNREAYTAAQMVIYYDSRKNLESRGIRMTKKAKPLPNPFPGNEEGCPTPPGWRK